MKIRNIGAGILIAGSTILGGCTNQAKRVNEFPKAFTREFAIRDSIVNKKIDDLQKLTKKGLPGGKIRRDEILFEMNKAFHEKFNLQTIKQDSIIRRLQGEIDSLKQIVKSNQK